MVRDDLSLFHVLDVDLRYLERLAGRREPEEISRVRARHREPNGDGALAIEHVVDAIVQVRERGAHGPHDAGDAAAITRHVGRSRRVVHVPLVEELGDQLDAALVPELGKVAANQADVRGFVLLHALLVRPRRHFVQYII